MPARALIPPAPPPSTRTPTRAAAGVIDALARAWGRAPVVLRRPEVAGFPTIDDVFAQLSWMGKQVRAGERHHTRSVELYLETEARDLAVDERYVASMVSAPGALLPRPEHRDFTSWSDFLARQIGGQRYGAVLGYCQVNPTCWAMLRELYAQLFARFGVPPGGANTIMFVGNYRRTPFGIHKDSAHITTLVVSGRKRMLLWPYEALADRPEVAAAAEDRGAVVRVRGPAEYEALLARAIVLEGDPGDILHWPASYWHIDDSPSDRLFSTVVLGYSVRAHDLWEKDDASAAGFAPRGPAAPPGSSRRRGRHLDAVARELRRPRMQAYLAARLLLPVLRHATSGGYLAGPTWSDGERAPLGPRVRVVGRPGLEVVLRRISSKDAILAGNGNTVVLRLEPAAFRALARVVARINAGEPRTVSALMTEGAGRQGRGLRRDLAAIIATLDRWEALVRLA